MQRMTQMGEPRSSLLVADRPLSFRAAAELQVAARIIGDGEYWPFTLSARLSVPDHRDEQLVGGCQIAISDAPWSCPLTEVSRRRRKSNLCTE